MRFAVIVAACLTAFASTVAAADIKAGSLTITDPYSRATPKGATIAGGFMKITNNGTTPDRLLGGSADVAAAIEMHETTLENDVAKMRPVTGGLEIKPGATVEFKPGSYHLMFVGLEKQLNAKDRIKATLMFEKAGKVEVDFDVLAMGAQPGHDHDTMPGMDMHNH